jgi:hypothetical protein
MFGRGKSQLLILLSILAILQVVLLAAIWTLLRIIRFAIQLISQQLEYLGAPLEIENGVLFCPARKARRVSSNEDTLSKL